MYNYLHNEGGSAHCELVMEVREVIDNSNSNHRVCIYSNDEIAQNIHRIREDINSILKSLGRDESDVILLGACKTMDKDVTDFVIRNRLLDALGDNKVQELLDKYEYSEAVPWHFIGNLQTNKVKYIIDKVTLIHSLDRVSLAKEIDKQAKKHDKIMECLIEVNIGEEESKGGVLPKDIDEFVEAVQGFDNIRIKGLMSVMPNEKDKALLDSYYDKFNAIFEKLKLVFGDEFTIKSIGMSGDYATALKHGANLIRIGRLIFGERRYS